MKHHFDKLENGYYLINPTIYFAVFSMGIFIGLYLQCITSNLTNLHVAESIDMEMLCKYKLKSNNRSLNSTRKLETNKKKKKKKKNNCENRGHGFFMGLSITENN